MNLVSKKTLSPRSLLALALAASLGVTACAPRTTVAPSMGPEAPVSPLLDPTDPLFSEAAPPRFKVLFETTAGDFVVEVDRALAPVGADRFYNLARNGYYDGVRFFRVVPGFVVQFGLSATPEITAAWRGARIPDDSVAASNTRGTVTYAMGGPNTRTTQIFINLGNNARLDDQGFAPFGRVTGGMDVVDRLHGGYGDGPPRGEGPRQDRIVAEGEAFLAQEFPLLDRILRIRVVEEPPPGGVDR